MAKRVKAKARYTVFIRGYRGGRMYEIKDEYWDSRENAFSKADGTFYSTNPGAEKVLREVPEFLSTAKVGFCYQLKTADFPFGALTEFTEVPAFWINL